MRRVALFMDWMCPKKSFQKGPYNQSVKKPVTIEVLVIGETLKTIQVKYKNYTPWLQKSLLMFEQSGGNKVNISIPNWLFIRKFTGIKSVDRKNEKHL